MGHVTDWSARPSSPPPYLVKLLLDEGSNILLNIELLQSLCHGEEEQLQWMLLQSLSLLRRCPAPLLALPSPAQGATQGRETPPTWVAQSMASACLQGHGDGVQRSGRDALQAQQVKLH